MRFSSLFCCILCWKKKKMTNSLVDLKKDKIEKPKSKLPLFNKNKFEGNYFNVKDTSVSMSYINKYELRNRQKQELNEKETTDNEEIENKTLKRNISITPIEIPKEDGPSSSNVNLDDSPTASIGTTPT